MASPRIKPGRTSTTGSKQYLEPSPHLPLHLATVARELVGNPGCLNSGIGPVLLRQRRPDELAQLTRSPRLRWRGAAAAR